MSKRGRGGSAGGKFRISLAMPVGAVINCADNTGGKNLYVIAVHGIRGRLNRYVYFYRCTNTQTKDPTPHVFHSFTYKLFRLFQITGCWLRWHVCRHREEGQTWAPQKGYACRCYSATEAIQKARRYFHLFWGQCWRNCEQQGWDERIRNYWSRCKGMRWFVAPYCFKCQLCCINERAWEKDQ